MIFEDWGLVDYEASAIRQQELVEQVHDGADERLIFCSHPPIVTLGRATQAEDVAGWTGKSLETPRGGRATYHGPSQLVIYPILDLKHKHIRFAERDIHAYLRSLEQATTATLHAVGLVTAEARTAAAGEISLTGVWVGIHKLASIGIAVRKWVSYHGVAINVAQDPDAFQGIRPCGFSPSVMSSVEAEIKTRVDRREFTKVARRIFESELKAVDGH